MTKLKWDDANLKLKLIAHDVIPQAIERIFMADKNTQVYIFSKFTRQFIAVIEP